eukprot:311175-Chlamydomonas_euryale.AAC.3
MEKTRFHTTVGGATCRHQDRHRSRRGPAKSRSRRVLPGQAAEPLRREGRATLSVGTAVSCGTRDSNTPF